MFALAILLTLSLGSCEISDTVDIWEHNTVIGCDGKPQMVQEIWWELKEHGGTEDYFVKAWRLSPQCNVVPCNHGGLFVGRFYDRKDKVRRVIRARLYFETESRTDFEVVDRDRLPADKRSGLKRR